MNTTTKPKLTDAKLEAKIEDVTNTLMCQLNSMTGKKRVRCLRLLEALVSTFEMLED